MSEVSIDQLKQAVEDMHGGTATFVHSVSVHETDEGKTVWYGSVHVFDLKDNPRIGRVYAWSSEVPGGERRFFAIPHAPPINSPVDAVRFGIVQEYRMNKFGREPTGKKP